MKILIAYVGYPLLTDMGVGLRVGELLKGRVNAELFDASMDVLSAVDYINASNADVVILVGAKRRKGREKGKIESYRLDLSKPADSFQANDLLRPSLEGRVCVTDIADGMRVLGVKAKEVYVFECEPPDDSPGLGLSPKGEECAERLSQEIVNFVNRLIGNFNSNSN